jgi:GT2 family glycosyltransferase
LKEQLHPHNYIASSVLSGRGVLIPIELFKKIGLYDQMLFPHYGADIDFSIRASKAGYKLLVSLNAIVYSHVKSTGFSIKNKSLPFFLRIKEGFFSIKSPNNFKIRYNLAIKHSPLKIIYFVLDTIRIISSSFKKSN